MVLPLLVACGGDKGDSGDDGGLAPDIAGRFNMVVLGVVGCESDPSWIDDWARGRLDISGSGSSLTWDFGDDLVFPGGIESDGEIRFSGSFDWQGASLSVSAAGQAEVAPTDPGDGSQMLLTGDITAVVQQDGQEDCTIDGPFEATELVDIE